MLRRPLLAVRPVYVVEFFRRYSTKIIVRHADVSNGNAQQLQNA
jgi:hypothetical protein